MDVSENSGTPKSSILIGFSIITHPFWGTPIFGNTHIDIFPYLLSLFLEPVLEPGQVPHPEVPSWARDFAALAELNKAQQPWDVPRGHDMSGETNTLLFRGLYYTAKPFSIMESKRFVFFWWLRLDPC